MIQRRFGRNLGVLAAVAGMGVAKSALAVGQTTQLSSNGAWTWFNDPRAVYDANTGRLYAGWISNLGQVQFSSYQFTGPGAGSQTVLDLNPSFERDDHNNPALQLHADGSLTAYYTWHRTETTPPNTRGVYFRDITPGPANTFTLSPQGEIKTAGDITGTRQNTYANPFHLTNDNGVDRSYLFSRGANFNPVYRTNDGSGWSASKNFVYNGSQRPYVKYNSNNLDTIGFTYTEGNPGSVDNNVYYAEIRGGAYYKPDGTKIQDLSSGPLSVGQGSKVFDRTANPAVTGDSSWVWDTARGIDGQPVIAFASLVSSSHHQYHWARWNGSAWEDRILVPNAGGNISGDGNYSGGIVLDPLDPRIVYLSRVVNGTFELEQWKTADDGQTWSSLAITSGTAAKDIRPFVPLDRPADTEMVLWLSGQYDHWDATIGNGFNTSVQLWTHTVPEPGGLAILLTGLGFLARRARR